MDINNRIAVLNSIFQELKSTHPTPVIVSKRKYKLSHEELIHIEAMLSETGLVDIVDEPYAANKYSLNSKGVNAFKKHSSYSDFLAYLNPTIQPATKKPNMIAQTPQKLAVFIISNI